MFLMQPKLSGGMKSFGVIRSIADSVCSACMSLYTYCYALHSLYVIMIFAMCKLYYCMSLYSATRSLYVDKVTLFDDNSLLSEVCYLLYDGLKSS